LLREEFNRAEALENDRRAGTVGFALTILQRRLASSPAAIHQSLRRRRERLESRLRELEVLQRGGQAAIAFAVTGPEFSPEDVEDLDEAPENEVEAAEQEVLDQATAARSIAELKAEIETLKALEALALDVRRSGTDTKWRELASLLGEIFTVGGLVSRIAEPDVPYGAGEIPQPSPSPRQKLVVFTEHRDTLSYLDERITSLLGRQESVVSIHGGVGREDRLKAQEAFRHDPQVQVLLATDAAGEGINLQRAHLMVNYDLPWNPNRLEQRFGRIHRIGQTEVCHLWNLVADETREGDVYRKLLEKLEQARQSLGGQVFDVLGKLHFEGRPLRELMVEAIRYGEQPEVRARLETAVDHALDRGRLAPGPAGRARPCARRHGRETRAAHPRGHGADGSAPTTAALRRVVLPRGVPAPRRCREAARDAALRDHPRSGAGSESGPPDRHRRAGAAALRANRLREVTGCASRPTAGRVRVSRAPAARCGDRPDAGTTP